MFTFERYLTLWGALCIAVGVYIAGLLISVGLYIVAPAILAQVIRQLTIAIGKIAESVLIYHVLMFLVSFWMGRWLPWQVQEPIGPDALARLAASNLRPAIV